MVDIVKLTKYKAVHYFKSFHSL